MRFSNVDLPTPESPMMAMHSPARRSTETLFNTRRFDAPAYVFTSPRSDNMDDRAWSWRVPFGIIAEVRNALRAISMSDEPKPPVPVPYNELSAEALRGVLEAFVLREGTDYGEREFSLEQKVAHVMRQLERGEAQIVFDPNTETVDIVRR